MSTRDHGDNDDALRDLLPDLETIRREADPALAEEKHRRALNNPDLDRALARVQRDAPGTSPAHVSEAPPVAAPIPAPGGPQRGLPRTPPWRAWAIGTVAVLAVVLPVAVKTYFEHAAELPPSASSAAIVASSPSSGAVSAAPAASAPEARSAEPPPAPPARDAGAGAEVAPPPPPPAVATPRAAAMPRAPSRPPPPQTAAPRAAPPRPAAPTAAPIAPDIMH